MKKLLLTALLLLVSQFGIAQRNSVRTSLYFPSSDSIEIRLDGNNDSNYISTYLGGQVQMFGARTRTPYSANSFVGFEIRTPDNDSALAGAYAAANGRLLLRAVNEINADHTLIIQDLVSGTTSPLLQLKSFGGSGAYIQYTEVGDQMYVSKPLSLPTLALSNSAGAIWRNANILYFGASGGKVSLNLVGGLAGQAFVSDGTGGWAPGNVGGGGGGSITGISSGSARLVITNPTGPSAVVTLPDGGIDSNAISAGVIPASKLKSGTIFAANMATGSVNSTAILDGTIALVDMGAASIGTSQQTATFKAFNSDSTDYARNVATTNVIAGNAVLGIGDSVMITTTYCDTSWGATADFQAGNGSTGSLQPRFYANHTVTFFAQDIQAFSGARFYFYIFKKQYPVGGVYK